MSRRPRTTRRSLAVAVAAQHDAGEQRLVHDGIGRTRLSDQQRRDQQQRMAEAMVADELQSPSSVPGVAILIELPGVGRVSIAASASPVLAAAALKALR